MLSEARHGEVRVSRAVLSEARHGEARVSRAVLSEGQAERC